MIDKEKYDEQMLKELINEYRDKVSQEQLLTIATYNLMINKITPYIISEDDLVRSLKEYGFTPCPDIKYINIANQAFDLDDTQSCDFVSASIITDFSQDADCLIGLCCKYIFKNTYNDKDLLWIELGLKNMNKDCKKLPDKSNFKYDVVFSYLFSK